MEAGPELTDQELLDRIVKNFITPEILEIMVKNIIVFGEAFMQPCFKEDGSFEWVSVNPYLKEETRYPLAHPSGSGS